MVGGATVIKGRYRFLGKIGAGGMGHVFKAVDLKMKRNVAVKILPPELSGNAEVRKRFMRELSVISSLSHPNVVRLYDYGQSGRTLFYVMEYINGRNLAQILKNGPLEVDKALSVLRGVLEALVEVHGHKLVHRDIKPANIMVDAGGRVVLMDFGLVKLFDSELTRTGKVLGTPRYLPPEMLLSGKVDARADLFQVSAVLYEMLTGVYAFKGDSRREIALAILNEDPELPSLLNPAIDINVENYVMNGLEKDPEKRYQSASQMLEILDELQRGGKIYRRHHTRRLKMGKAAEANARSAGDEAGEVVTPVFEPIDRLSGAEAAEVVRSSDVEPRLGEAEAASGGRWMMWVCLLLGLSIVVMGFAGWYWGRGREWSVREFAVDFDGPVAVVHWRADRELPARIYFGGRDGGAMQEAVGSVDSEGLHEVRLRGLEPGRSYVCCVVFPDGTTSKSVAFTAPALEISEPRWTYAADKPGMVEVRWRTSVPMEAEVKLEQDGRVVAAARSTPARIVHRVMLPLRDTSRGARVDIECEFPGGGSIPPKVLELPSLLDVLVEKGKAFCSSMDRVLTRKNLEKLLSEPLGRRRSKYVELLEKEHLLRMLRRWWPSVGLCADNRALPARAVLDMYRYWSRALQLDAVARLIGAAPVADLADDLPSSFALDCGGDAESPLQRVPLSVNLEGEATFAGRAPVGVPILRLPPDAESVCIVIALKRFAWCKWIRLHVGGGVLRIYNVFGREHDLVLRQHFPAALVPPQGARVTVEAVDMFGKDESCLPLLLERVDYRFGIR